MHTALRPFLLVANGTTAGLLAVVGLLHLVPRLGNVGRRLSEALCRAPGLDALVLYLTVLPLIVGPIFGGWAGLAGALAGQGTDEGR